MEKEQAEQILTQATADCGELTDGNQPLCCWQCTLKAMESYAAKQVAEKDREKEGKQNENRKPR